MLQSFGKRAARPQRGLVACTPDRGLLAGRPQRGLKTGETVSARGEQVPVGAIIDDQGRFIVDDQGNIIILG